MRIIFIKGYLLLVFEYSKREFVTQENNHQYLNAHIANIT